MIAYEVTRFIVFLFLCKYFNVILNNKCDCSIIEEDLENHSANL